MSDVQSSSRQQHNKQKTDIKDVGPTAVWCPDVAVSCGWRVEETCIHGELLKVTEGHLNVTEGHHGVRSINVMKGHWVKRSKRSPRGGERGRGNKL